MEKDFNEVAMTTFKAYDKNKSGFMDLKELKNLMNDVAKEISIPPPDDAEIEETLKQFDLNKDNKISEEEFLKLFKVIHEMKNNNK